MNVKEWKNLIAVVNGVALASAVSAVHADNHGGVEFEGGITVTAQASDDNAVDDELFSSVDLVTSVPVGPGTMTLYVEGNTSSKNDGIINMVGEANGDGGSALDGNGDGRLQVSEWYYTQAFGDSELSVGLIDVTVYLDGNGVANDETAQFLGGSFVNNPVIEFPDYTLGAAYHRELSADTSLTAVLTSSHGLGDNPDASYSDLFDVSEDGKGVFAALEGGFNLGEARVAVGGWLNTADHAQLAGPSTDENNYGLYSNIDFSLGEVALNVRLGWADDDVSEAETFVGVAAEIPTGIAPLGVAIGHIGLADAADVVGTDDTTHAEVYMAFNVNDQLQVTPSVQWIENTGFDSSDSVVDMDQFIFSLRGTYAF